MSERAMIFGDDAEAYHRFRPDYPASIVSLIASHADGQVTRALEIGAGTGKATMVVASQGIEVLAVEPDTRMSSVLEARAGELPIQIVHSTFEALDLDAIGHVDLVFAAAAFHWTDPETRWQRTATVLRPGGVAAFFGAMVELGDDLLSGLVDQISESVLGFDAFDLGAIAGTGADNDHWPASDLRRREEFTDVVETTIPRRTQWSSVDFVAHLSTVSAYRLLTLPQRDAVLSRIRAVLPDIVEIAHDVTLSVARRV